MKTTITKEKIEGKFQKNRIFDFNDSNIMRLSSELALEIGLNESIIFLQIEFWIAISNNVQDGRKWTYQSLTDLKNAFPFWSKSTLNRAIISLEDQGLIVIDKFNKAKYDKTRWFAIDLDGAAKLKSISIMANETRSNQTETTSSKTEQSDKNQRLASIAETILKKLMVINPVIVDDKLQRDALRQMAECVEAGTITMNDIVLTADLITDNTEQSMVIVQPTSILKRVGTNRGELINSRAYHTTDYADLYDWEEVDKEEYEDKPGFIDSGNNQEFNSDDCGIPF